MSRRFLAATSGCSRWAPGASRDDQVSVLLISNPTGDLDGAEKEAAAIREALASQPRFKLDNTLRKDTATRAAILAKLAAGGYDIVHYSGHAYFDPEHRDSCGLLCHKDEVLTGKDLAGIAKLPFLLVLNACQSARTRAARRPGTPARTPSAPRTIAETMLCSGIANFIGTYWPVDDAGAEKFAKCFYEKIIAGKNLGDAILAARGAISDQNDWANYILFGNPEATLKAG